MEVARSGKLPTSFWVISVLGFLWNAFGASLYLMARLNPDTVMAAATPEMRAYVDNMPLWANIGYGFGIWGSFAGSVLMLLRRRHALTAFIVSLAGAALSFAGQAAAGVLTPAEPIMILVVIAFLAFYCRNCIRNGLLT